MKPPAPRGWIWFLRNRGREPLALPQPIFTLARPRRLQRSARPVLLWSLALYALAALVLNGVMDRWCPAPFEKVYRIKWEGLSQLARREPDRPLLIMLGSSRTDGAFQAGRLNGVPGPGGRPLLAFNFGVPAAGPMHEYQYLRDLLDEGIRPCLLLVEFLPPLLNEPHSHLISEENWAAADWMSLHQYVRLYPYLRGRGGRRANGSRPVWRRGTTTVFRCTAGSWSICTRRTNRRRCRIPTTTGAAVAPSR